MKGKDKCKILKEIRAQIAAANDIAWVTENCTHKGECRGTCPKCEAEVLTLERALERRRAMGKRIAVVGLSAGILATATACSDPSGIEYTPPVGQESDATIGIGAVLPGEVFMGAPETAPIEVDGDYVLLFYSTDYTPCDPISYLTAERMSVDRVHDFPYTDEGIWEIPKGAVITVIGVSGPQETVLISYRGQQFVLWAGWLEGMEQIAEPTQPNHPA